MAETNTLMMMAQESAAAQGRINTSPTTQNQAGVALDTLQFTFLSTMVTRSTAPIRLNTYIKDSNFVPELSGCYDCCYYTCGIYRRLIDLAATLGLHLLRTYRPRSTS